MSRKVMMSRVQQHGVRRAAEMREASRMIAELGLDGSLASAIADRQESFAARISAASARHTDREDDVDRLNPTSTSPIWGTSSSSRRSPRKACASSSTCSA